ncbi:2,3-bisphosphoglycerate-dependent phosphoglycerate mutase [Paenibacillus rhizosphaerae]|uniref:2,3-bisphosphoglycerate-dependent phosphoglycerate mutase n=1 Tax=Paenibacillus rhizosphaerae TaxID=297318 RepID=A0A839TUZ6_9BACL|nr:histidine phosphatase family protein [Paenibacillus rhizosphaerae]MBB3129410.1 2,3-bisphosphoglycerate-dependent phosphoglycerate mutase [Paenibacillus rhizosphaerae]
MIANSVHHLKRSTILYFVRHAESPYEEGRERTRGLSRQGLADALAVKDRLLGEGIDLYISSPYERAVRTIRDAADTAGKEIIIEEDLREREIGQIGALSFQDAKRRVYGDAAFAFPGGESSLEARQRAVRVIRKLLEQHAGQRIVIGTHGDIMTLMLGEFDSRFDYAFWESTSMPDIYKTEWEGETLRQVTRTWRE